MIFSVCSTRVTQDKTSLGRGEILKEREICAGRKMCKWWVSASSKGLLPASRG
jgi:hypothetical protein